MSICLIISPSAIPATTTSAFSFVWKHIIDSIPMTIALGLWGMAIALVVVNLIKILIIMAVGCAKI